MPNISQNTLKLLIALNKWLSNVFGEDTLLSTLLIEADLSEIEIERIKTNHLHDFLIGVAEKIETTTDRHDGNRRNAVVVRYYGLKDGQKETLQSIGDSLGLSRERIRQLVKKRIRLYQGAKRKELFKADLAIIAHEILNKD